MKKLGYFCMVLCAVILAGCTSTNVHQYGQIDQSDKSITVPSGTGGLKGAIKTILHDDGWKMTVFKGPSITEGTTGKETLLKSYETSKTRYTLWGQHQFIDYCLTGESYYQYEITIIDNKSGTEVLSMDGLGCEKAITKQFSNMLANN